MSANQKLNIAWPGGGAEAPALPGTALDSFLKAGIPIQYNCKRGDCLQCVARVIKGDNTLQLSGIVKLCCTPAFPGSSFELIDDPYLVVEPARLFPARVVSVSILAAGIYRLVIRTPPKMLLNFQGGQYATLRVGGIERSYSILSADGDQVAFIIKVLPQGAFGRWLSTRAVEGAMLYMHAPLGRFTLRKIVAKNTYFISTGTGIVPILAMLQRAEINQVRSLGRLKVFWGNRLKSEVFQFEELARECERLGAEFELVYSAETDEPSARVTTRLAYESLSDSNIYAAGNPNMIKEIQALWLTRSSTGRFFSDAFAFAGSQEGSK